MLKHGELHNTKKKTDSVLMRSSAIKLLSLEIFILSKLAPQNLKHAKGIRGHFS